MVMDESKFKDRVVLKVETEKMTPEGFGKTEEYWKNVCLNFPVRDALTPSNYEWLYPSLSEVEFLSLRLHGSLPLSSSVIIDFHILLGRLLSSCKKLKSLALEPAFIVRGSGRISEGTDTLENLEQLEILQPDYRDSILPLSDFDYKEDERKTLPEFCGNLKNVKVYKSYFVEFAAEMGCRGPWTDAVFLQMLCETIVKSNCQHLQSCPFYDVIHVSVSRFALQPISEWNYDTPALIALQAKHFKLETPTGVADFISCLNSRPPLEQLDICCSTYLPTDNMVYSDLVTSVAHHRMSLKRLRLDTVETRYNVHANNV